MKLNIVPARTGLVWVRSGIRTFFRQPLAMGGLFFLFLMAASLLSLLPGVGFLLAMAAFPLGSLGLMAASAEADRGKFPMPALLIVGLRGSAEQRRSILILGAYFAAGFGLILLASSLVDGGTFARLYTQGGRLDAKTVDAPGFTDAIWVTLVLYLPLSMLFWHAPALVHWHGVTPAKSLFFSFVACWRNGSAFVVYGLAWAAVLFGAFMLLATVASISQSTAINVAIPMALLMSAMFFTSVYFTYRDSFAQEPAHEPPSP